MFLLGQVNGCTNLMNTSPSSVRIVGTSREPLEPLDTVSPFHLTDGMSIGTQHMMTIYPQAFSLDRSFPWSDL